MADKYTIQIQPQIGASDALKMEQDLNRRFGNVAKKFGSHIGSALKGAGKIGMAGLGVGLAGGVIGMAAAILTNPIEKIDNTLNSITAQADQIATNANKFGVTTAKYAELLSVAGSYGLDPNKALMEFSDLLQEARLFKAGDTSKNATLVNYLNQKDLIDNFYSFAQSMSKLAGDQRSIEVSKVFGNKIEDKLAEFLQSTDLEKRKKAIRAKGISPQQVGASIDKISALEDIQALNREKIRNEMFVKGARAISSGTMTAQAQQERQKMLREVSQLSQYEIFANLAVTQERMAAAIDGIRADLTALLLPLLTRIVDGIEWIVGWIREKIRSLKKLNPFD